MNSIAPDLRKVSRLPLRAGGQAMGDGLEIALSEARDYIGFYDWGREIKSEYLGYDLEGVIYIFLFEISPGRPDVPQWIWVIVGDVPSAFIPGDESKTPYQALDE